MLRILIKKQLYEAFKGFFYNTKTNKAKNIAGTVKSVILFLLLTVGLVGGMFGFIAVTICGAFVEAGTDWLYFLIFSGISIALGLFGSVFNTYSGLYLAKDNDLLLSMPIPVGMVIASRVSSVYILGAFYSGLIYIPAVIVHQITVGFSLSALIGGIVSFFEMTVLILSLSCLLGFAVAKISLKLKGKSFTKVLLSLIFIGAYYLVYFKAQTIINNLMVNASVYGEKIKTSAYLLYGIGENAVGKPLPMLCCFVALSVFFIVIWLILSKTFLKIATASQGNSVKVKTVKTEKALSVKKALLKKEFSRFTASSTYMLNCGLGILLLPIVGIILLIKASGISASLSDAPASIVTAIPVLIAGVSCLIGSMIDTAAPSVSLEGKSLWVLQSLPVSAFDVIKAKIKVQLILSYIPIAFFNICLAVAMVLFFHVSALGIILCLVLSFIFPVLSAFFSMFIGLKMPNLIWTDEVTPIKQSGGVVISIFGVWGYAGITVGGYFVLSLIVGLSPEIYLAAMSAVTVVLSVVLYNWLKKKGTVIFEKL